MDKDAKERLDGLVLKLQKRIVAANNSAIHSNLEGQRFAYDITIRDINNIFDTQYETNYPTLEEYFREKPCERR